MSPRERIAAGEACILVTVMAVTGSAPREAGASMLVWARGQEGTVGGGNLEYRLADQARRMLTGGDAFAVQEYPLGPLLGQCCGGKVRVLLERLDETSQDFLAGVAAADAAGWPYLIETRVAGGSLHKQIIEACGDESMGRATLFDNVGRPLDLKAPRGDFVMIETVNPQKPTLALFGAGHVGQATARILATLPVSLRWFDTREDYRGFSVGGQDVEMVSSPREAATAMPPDALYLIFTHSHALDYEITHAVLGRGDFRYCGLIGSRTKRARFERRLAEDGIPRTALDRLVCPIGAIGLSSKAPEVMAVAIATELLLTLESVAPRILHDH